MNKEIVIPSVKINLFIIIPYVLLIVLAIFFVLQWKSNYEINQANKLLHEQNEILDNKNDSILNVNSIKEKKIKEDSLFIVKSQLKVDALLKSDSIQKKQLNTIKWRYAKLKNNYNTISNDDKWSVLTELIDE